MLSCRTGFHLILPWSELVTRPEEIAELILECHVNKNRDIFNVSGFKLELQLNYTGRMAQGAYNGWKMSKHIDRPKVGCFDFKIFRLIGRTYEGVSHVNTLKKLGKNLPKLAIEKVFRGEDPRYLGLSSKGLLTVEELQLEMLEQEVNWGDEIFQSWSHFLPSKGKRPRDFIMAYVRRLFDEPGYLTNVKKIRAASGTFDTLPPPINDEWLRYLEPKKSTVGPWVTGKLLRKFKDATASMPDNPRYANLSWV